MKKNSLLKSIVVIGLSLMLILILGNRVLAADEDFEDLFGNTDNSAYENATQVPSNEIENTAANEEKTNVTNNTDYDYPDITNTNYTNTDNYVSNNTSNEAMPYTGIEDVNTVLVIAVLIGAMVAIYSYKKIDEYKNV